MHKINYLSHNWLALKINNRTVSNHSNLYTGTVYDLGCGTRPYEPDILKFADRYIGVDWSNTLHGLQADIVADLNKHLPIEDEVADAVVSFQVMEHLCEPQVMLNEAFRILKQGGKILLTVPFQWHVHEAPYDFYRYTRHGLEYMFAKSGFVDVQVKEASGFWSMWLLKFNYQTVRLARGPLPIRFVLRTSMLPLWLFNQWVAPMLDNFWPAPAETAGYVVTARKPTIA